MGALGSLPRSLERPTLSTVEMSSAFSLTNTIDSIVELQNPVDMERRNQITIAVNDLLVVALDHPVDSPWKGVGSFERNRGCLDECLGFGVVELRNLDASSQAD